jgi:pimeloyl-ACP methyl ester carboxylesterase
MVILTTENTTSRPWKLLLLMVLLWWRQIIWRGQQGPVSSQRVKLLQQALDLAYALNQNISSPLFNKLDVNSGYVIGGHSWGGATASLYSLMNRQGVRGSFIMDEIAMISNPDYYPRQDGLQSSLPLWYSDPNPFGELPMIYVKAPRSPFDEGVAEGASAYTSAPFTTIVSNQEAFHESLLDAYPAQIVDKQVANSTRQTAAHFIGARL